MVLELNIYYPVLFHMDMSALFKLIEFEGACMHNGSPPHNTCTCGPFLLITHGTMESQGQNVYTNMRERLNLKLSMSNNHNSMKFKVSKLL